MGDLVLRLENVRYNHTQIYILTVKGNGRKSGLRTLIAMVMHQKWKTKKIVIEFICSLYENMRKKFPRNKNNIPHRPSLFQKLYK